MPISLLNVAVGKLSHISAPLHPNLTTLASFPFTLSWWIIQIKCSICWVYSDLVFKGDICQVLFTSAYLDLMQTKLPA